MPFSPVGSDDFTQLASRLIRSNASNLDAFGTPIEGENLLIDLVLKVVREESNNAKLIWEAQGSNLPDFHGIEIQVAESEAGPWYAMVNPAKDGEFKNNVEHSYFVLTTNVVSGSIVHADLPDDVTIYYRLRVFNQSGAKGKYSNIASVVLIAGEITEVTSGDIINPYPTSPILSAKTANGNNILTWTRQGGLLDYSHSEIQVADTSVGPWFKPDIIGGDTTYRGTTPYTSDLVPVWETAADFNFVHPSVPSIILYYRVRTVNTIDERSDWSNTIAISAAIVLEAPILAAIGSLDDIILKWEKQDLLLFEKGIRVQVAEAAGGPWYAPDDDIINDIFRGTIVGEYLLVTGNEWVHRDIPLVGDINNNPSLRTLYYRIRRVDFSDNVSPWSNTASATAGRITLASLPGLVDVGKLDPDMFDILGAFSEHALGHWPLDDTVTGSTPNALGELVDLTIHNNPLKVTSSTVGEAAGILSKSLTFSGSAGSVARTDTGIGSSGDTWEQFSFSFWLRMPSTQVNTNLRPISYFVGNTVIYFHVIPATGLHELRIRVGTILYSIVVGQARNLNDDQWHHVFLSYNGSSTVGKIFIDAIEFAKDIIQGAPASIDQGGNLSIGAARVNSVNTNHMAGRIDEVRIFSFEPELQHVRYLYFIPQGPLAPIVDAPRIPPLVIDGSKLAPNAVTESKIINEAITIDKIAPLAVTVDKIAPLAVTESKINDDSISTPKLKANAVIADKIAANAIISDKIAANSIISDKIAANSIISDKIAANVVTAQKIAALTITGNEIAAGAITANKLAVGVIPDDIVIDWDDIPDDTITSDMIQDASIIANKIVANAIVAGKIAANAVVASNIAANSIIAGKIAANAIIANNISANAIVAGKIAANAVVANNIGANQIISSHIIANSIIAAKIAAGAVTADKIAALAITAEKIAVDAIRVGTNGNVIIDDDGIVSDMIAAQAVTADKLSVGALFVGENGNVTIDDEGITAPMLAANSVNLGSANVFGTLTADHIESDVINVRNIWTGDVDRETGGSNNPATLTNNTTIFNGLDISQFPYIMILAKISNFNFTHIIPRTSSQRVAYGLDTTRLLEIWYDAGTDSLIIDRSVEHEEFGAPDIGTLTIYAVFGVTYPDATYVSPPDPTQTPGVPSGLGSTETPGSSTWDILGTWNQSTNASGYIIEYQSREPGGAWPTTVSTTTSTGTSVTLYGSLTQNREYRFRVQATNSENASIFSVWYEDEVGIIVPVPSSPGNFRSIESENSNPALCDVYSAWNSVPTATSYTWSVWRRATSSNSWEFVNSELTTNLFSDTLFLNDGWHYRWRVYASNSGGDSNEIEITGICEAAPITAPNTPSTISLSSTTNSVSGTISSSSGATYYQWKRSTSGTWITISGGGRSFTDTGLNSNTNYTYNARAGNDGGTSGTVTRSITTQVQEIINPPNTPSNIRSLNLQQIV